MRRLDDNKNERGFSNQRNAPCKAWARDKKLSSALALASVRKIFFASMSLLTAVQVAFARGDDHPEFAVAKMPDSLARNADAVIRLATRTFQVESPKRATEHVLYAVTIFTATGREAGSCAVWYDRFRELKSLRGVLYDVEGRKIRELKNADVNDYSAISGYSLYDDNRARVAELVHDAYPYTVLFEYELVYNGLINWPTWYPQSGGYAVERTWFELHVPAEMPVRYHLNGKIAAPQVRTVAARKVYRWEAALVAKYEHEPYGPPWSEQAAAVLTAPQQFEIAGYAGDLSSWQSFGQWVQQLYVGRNALPPEALAQVQQVCAGLASPKEKARALYEKLQSTTRYVSVQLGVGGWQPFDATYVFTRGYGDCKALSNYMVAMLQAVGIAAYPVLIRLGEDEPEVQANFPSNQFNHVIVCVPFEQDTVWLECTSAITPFGFLGTSTEDRNALLITPSGGKIVRTPASHAQDNLQVRRARIVVAPNGDGHGEVRTLYTGNQHDRVRAALAHKTPQEREDWLRREIDIAGARFLKTDYAAVDNKAPELQLPLTVDLPRLASRSGTRLFLKTNLLNRWKYVPPALTKRTQPVALSYRFVDLDSITYVLPEGYGIEAAPAAVKIATPFASYSAAAEFTGANTLLYVRRLEMRENKLPVEQYEAYRKFRADLVKADAMQVVLIKQSH